MSIHLNESTSKFKFHSGDYSDSQVNLDNNHLTMMDENVFKEMLDHMTQSGAGSLSIRYSNKCHSKQYLYQHMT